MATETSINGSRSLEHEWSHYLKQKNTVILADRLGKDHLKVYKKQIDEVCIYFLANENNKYIGSI